MKSIKELKHPDIVKVNGKKFQVIYNTSLWYDSEKRELEMAVELIKIGEKGLTPTYRLTYVYEYPKEIKFFSYDKKTEEFKEQKLNSIKF